MTTSELCSLGELIKQITTPDAYLCFWTVRSMIEEALQVLDAWGFKYRCELFTWVKTTKNGLLFKSPGSYSLGNTEAMWLARRVNDKGRLASQCWHSNAKGEYKPHQVHMLPHPRGEDGKIIHSRKPEEFHLELEKWLFPYLKAGEASELFATQSRPGWNCFGHALSGNSIEVDLKEYYGLK